MESKSILFLDVATRWNSTYNMLENAEKFEEAFKWMEIHDPSYKSHFHNAKSSRKPPNEEDWEKILETF